MSVNHLKKFAIVIVVLPLLLIFLNSAPPVSQAAPQDESAPVNYADTAGTYKAKCNVCHKANAEKNFDPSKSDTDLTAVVMNGKKMEKPPHMPGYSQRGMNADQAKAFVAYMRDLRSKAPAAAPQE